MVIQIVRDAIWIKLRAREESPLISVHEFCYAAGVALLRMGTDSKKKEEIGSLEDFEQMKTQVKELVREAEVWNSFPEGERLKSLILGCRVRGKILEESRELFRMGLSGK